MAPESTQTARSFSMMKKSTWCFHINTGSCNGCDIEILDVLTPRFDVERFGMKLVASPRHADLAMLTGPITIKALPKVYRAIKAMPRPRLILAVGSCAVGGGIWFYSYSTVGGFPQLLDLLNKTGVVVDGVVYVPGCPARPEAIIQGAMILLGYAEQKTRYKRIRAINDEQKCNHVSENPKSS